MNRSIRIAILVAVSALLGGCGGDPTKEETCGECSELFAEACEAGYDVCADTDDCSLGDYKKSVEDGGICG